MINVSHKLAIVAIHHKYNLFGNLKIPFDHSAYNENWLLPNVHQYDLMLIRMGKVTYHQQEPSKMANMPPGSLFLGCDEQAFAPYSLFR